MKQTPSVEKAMLNSVALFDPIDWWSLKRRVRELVGDVETDVLRTALSNLEELGLVSKPGIAHEHVHITEAGWCHLGGLEPRYEEWPDVTESQCPYCYADRLVESEW